MSLLAEYSSLLYIQLPNGHGELRGTHELRFTSPYSINSSLM